ncbi:hypothetical protein KGY58_05060 [Candidatus Bipolaricaulota bacterium]|nr:hypothetical protein [Candidatus Bipolaricaulota bacterium]
MTKKVSYIRRFTVLSLCLVVSLSLVSLSDEVEVTPLLDTPDNQAYYDKLMEAVKGARSSIEIMMSTADHYPDYPNGLQRKLFDALLEAKERGAEVRLILDESNWSDDITNTNKETATILRNRGLDVKFDDPDITTHAKLVVVDNKVVILGSSNWNFPTYTETYQSNIALRNRSIAKFYGKVFDWAWSHELVGGFSIPDYKGTSAIVPLVSFGKNRAYYEETKKMITNAEDSIDLVLFKITYYSEFRDSMSNVLLRELVNAYNRGVSVRIVLDVNNWSKEINQSNRKTALWLLGKGIRKVSFESLSTTTHSKLVIVDGESVILGSTNWSYYSLEKNFEADISIRNTPSVSKVYQRYFEELWKRAKIPSREKLSGEL